MVHFSGMHAYMVEDSPQGAEMSSKSLGLDRGGACHQALLRVLMMEGGPRASFRP